MICYITSIGETTTELCEWSMERNGFDVTVLKGDDSLANKLKDIYESIDQDFVRVDADVIPNSKLKPNALRGYAKKYWWIQFVTFDMYKLDLTYGGVQYIRREALPALRNNIGMFLQADRPESQMYRLDEFDNPRRCKSDQVVMGLHGFAQKDIKRVKRQKAIRNQYYDWELYERVEALCSK